MIRHLVTTK